MNASVAQWIEHQTSNLGVAGSSPAWGKFFFNHCRFFSLVHGLLLWATTNKKFHERAHSSVVGLISHWSWVQSPLCPHFYNNFSAVTKIFFRQEKHLRKCNPGENELVMQGFMAKFSRLESALLDGEFEVQSQSAQLTPNECCGFAWKSIFRPRKLIQTPPKYFQSILSRHLTVHRAYIVSLVRATKQRKNALVTTSNLVDVEFLSSERRKTRLIR